MRKLAAVVSIVLICALAFAGWTLAAGDAAKGKAAFQQYCSGCHGVTGKGDGAMGAALNPKPKDLSSKAFNASLKDDYLVKLINEGGQAVGKSPLMPKLGDALKGDQVQDLVAFLRSLAK